MSIEVPLIISAVPGVARVAWQGMPGIGVNAVGIASSQDDSNGPHVLLTTQALTGNGVYVETDARCISTQTNPDVSFRITTGASIADLALWVGLFRAPPGEAANLDTEAACVRYSTDADGTVFWRAVTVDASGVVETTPGSAGIATTTEYLIRVACTSTTAALYVNGTLIATHSGNVPTSTTLMRVGVYLATLADAAKSVAFGWIRAGQVDHGQTAGLTDDDHSQYALLAGRSGGQTLKGDTASGGSLTLESTSHATKGGVKLAAGDWFDVPEVSAPGTPASGRVRIYAKADGLVYAKDDAGAETKLSNVAGGSGDVVGPASATDSAIALFDGTTGKLLKDSTYPITAAGAALIDDANAAAQRSTLGLGSIATQDAANVTISGGVITGITDLAVGDGGTGASTAGAARTNLGVGTADSPEFAGVNLGHASDTTITRTGAGDIAIEGNAVYRAGGTDVPVADGGTGASTAAGARTNLGLVINTDVPSQASFDDHSARHESGGADAIKLDDLAAPDDNTDLDASTSAHGLLKKLPGGTTTFLRGDGTFATPSVSAATGIIVKRKTADESVTSSTVQQDDDTFSIPFAAGESWVFTITLYIDGATAGDFAFNFSGAPVGFSGVYGIVAPSASTAFDTAAPESAAADEVEMYGGSGISTIRNIGCAGAGSPVVAIISGSFTSPLNSGTLTLAWAQRVSNATATTVKTGSHMTAFRTT